MNAAFKKKLQRATEAIDAVFGDTTVEKAENLEALQDLQSDIDAKIECLRDDIEKETGERP